MKFLDFISAASNFRFSANIMAAPSRSASGGLTSTPNRAWRTIAMMLSPKNRRVGLRLRLQLVANLIAVAIAFMPAIGSPAVQGIENPTCERIHPGVYAINFQSAPDAGAIEVYASSRPDRIDSGKPAARIHSAPAIVSVPQDSGRVYFHLKPASGPPRVVPVRRLPLGRASNFRDLGGYRTSDGQYVRWGLVYRSGYLADLTGADYEYLNRLGIRLVCDVRADRERMRSP